MLDSVAQEILAALEPMLYADAENNNALQIYLGSLGDVLFQEVEDYSSDTEDGKIGWSLLVDIDRAPDKALPWLAQFVGVSLTGGLTATEHRDEIRHLSNLGRGTKAAMSAAPAAYLTGTKTVIFRERFDPANPTVDSPGYLQVITYTSETPDPVAVLAALMRQKPAGIVLDYDVNAGQDFLSLRTNNATFQVVKDNFATFQGVKLATPGI